MPPEPLPSDRKDFFKERKRERSESLGSPGVCRWRDSSSYHGSRESHRWGSTNYRRHPGHGNQGGSHNFPEESGRGISISRSADKMLEDESCRSSISRGEGKYGRSIRDSKSYFSQRDYRGYPSDLSNGSPNASRRPLDANNDPRSVDDALPYPPNSHPDFMQTWDQRDKVGGVNGLGTGQRFDRENTLVSVDWKPFKWARPGSRGSGFCHSISSRSNGGIDSGQGKTDLSLKIGTHVDSPSGDAAACVTSAALSEETTSRKKPRLGWGEGLAKYEKKKIDGPDVSTNKDAAVFHSGGSEPGACVGAALVDRSPKMTGFSDCASPSTPSSVACSSSPGLEDKLFEKPAKVDLDVASLSNLPVHVPPHHIESLSFNLENFGTESLVRLVSSLSELLQEDPGSVDSTSIRSAAMRKLLIWKADFSKVLETTESEIDFLETEWKSLKSGLRDACSHPPPSSSFTDGYYAKSCDACVGGSNMASHLKRLKIASIADANMENPPAVNINAQSSNDNGKDDDVDSPGTATSKFVERMPLVQVGKDGFCSSEMDAIQSRSLAKCLIACSNKRGVNMPAYGDGDMSGVKGKVEISAVPDRCDDLNDICNVILAANKQLANSAAEIFDMPMAIDGCKMDNLGPISDVWPQNDPLMKVKFASRNRLLRFRERVIAIKFKAFRHLWREDMRLLSIKKSSLKSHRKLEISLRKVGCGYQKPRSSIRSRFPYPSGNLSLVPTSEMIAHTKKLLSTSQHKPLGNTLKMPGMILDDKEKIVSRFISSNGLVEDPLAFEKEREMINPWKADEREIFLDKLVIYGKDFRRIASFLDHKTTADCVEFYYKNHKSEGFSKIMKQQGKRFSLTTKLAASGSKWNREISAASLDILSAASVMAGQANGITVKQQMHSGRSLLGGYGSVKTSDCSNHVLERSNRLDVVRDERETVAADVLAGICSSFASEAINSGVTKFIRPAKRRKEWIQWPPSLDATQSMDDDTCSDESCGEMDPSDWLDEEKATFLRALTSYGKDFGTISRRLRTRSRDQCKAFFSKARKCLGLDAICSRLQKERSPLNDDVNGGGTDKDKCAIETGFLVGTNKLGNKMEDMPSSVMIISNDELYPVDGSNLSIEALNTFDAEKKDHGNVNNLVSDLRIRGFSGAVFDGDGDVSVGSDSQLFVALAEKNKTASPNSEGGVVRANELENRCAKSASNEDAIEAGASISVDLANKIVVSSGIGLSSVHNSFNSVGEISFSVPNSGPQTQPDLPLEKPSRREISRSSMNSVLKDSGSVRCEKTVCQNQMSVTLDSKGGKVRDSHKSVNVLQGYPSQLSVNEKVNDDVSCTSSVTESPLLSRKDEELGDHPRSHSRSLSTSAKPCRNGNVKLFGKILDNPSMQKRILTNNNESENKSRTNNIGNKSSTVKVSSRQKLDANSGVSRFHHSSCHGHENSSVKIEGLREDNRTRSGFSPVPNSAKYPASLGTTPTAPAPPPPKLEQHSVETVGNGIERNLNGDSAFRDREKNCSNGVVDCGMYRSRDGQKMQPPLKADLDHRQDVYWETQRRNGFEAMTGTLHQGKSSIVVGVSCPGVSDPVAAIRMHYSNVDQNGSTVRENESGGAKGNIGR